MEAELSRNSVTVICRLPSGLVLDLYDMKELGDRNKAGQSVGAPAPVKTVRVQGARHDPRFHKRDNVLLGMGGRTQVDKEFWDAWCAQNANFGPLKNGLIFAAATESKALGALAEKKDDRTGFEGCTDDQLKKSGVTRFSQDDE